MKLSGGGKDGIFLIVMSIGWWAHAHDRAVDSKLDAAIGDVSWVIKQLVASLSARAVSRTSSPPRNRSTSGEPLKKRSRTR